MASSASATAATAACVFCLKNIDILDTTSKLNCGHQSHRDCLQPRLDSNHNTCPLDGRRIVSINGVALEQSKKEEDVHEAEGENPLSRAQVLYLQQKGRAAIEEQALLNPFPIPYNVTLDKNSLAKQIQIRWNPHLRHPELEVVIKPAWEVFWDAATKKFFW